MMMIKMINFSLSKMNIKIFKAKKKKKKWLRQLRNVNED